MPPAVEALVDAALVAIITDSGEVCGTGFVIDEYGTVLTCHHVVNGLALVRLRGPDGSIHEVGQAAIIAAPEIDLALIRVSAALGIPLPIVSDASVTTEYWTKGYHQLGQAIRAAYPVQGRIIGRTSIFYRSDKFGYEISDALVLRDDSIDPGLSGAPVLDPQAGVVVGVVSTKLVRRGENSGFAVPIALAAAHPALEQAVTRNQTTIPAFGAYLNAAAAHTLCRAVTNSEIDNLAQLRSVDLSRRVPRTEIEAAVDRFLSSDSLIFALVGPSGVGKSTEVAALARRLPGRALLLRGSSLRPDSAGDLGDSIQDALDGVDRNGPLPKDAGKVIARVLGEDSGLVVLLDALNEAPLSGRAFEEWIASTRSWLRTTSAKLVVSCRSELWGDLIGRLLSVSFDDRNPVVIPLGAFTDEEYQKAAHVYGLSAGVDWPILHLPLALSLCTRYQQRQPKALDAVVSLNEVIELYVEEAARNLATRGNRPPLSARVMRNRLVEAAAVMRERDTDVVDLPSLGEVFGTTSTVDALVSEGVMSSTPSGFRFVYDDVGDWLQAQGLDVDSELTAIITDKFSSWRRVGAVAVALRDVERRRGPEALRTRLSQLIQNSIDADNIAFWVVEETLVKIVDAQLYDDVLNHMVDIIISSARPPADSLDTDGSDAFDHIGFWRSVSLPLARRLELLRRLCRFDEYYHWRPKDWSFWGQWPNEWDISISYSALTYSLIQRQPEIGIPALVPWLDDHNTLAGGEAKVAFIAMGILFQFRKEKEQLVWAAMIEAGDRAEQLVTRLAMDDPESLVRMMSNAANGQSSDELVTCAAYALGRAQLSEELMQAAQNAVSKRYARGLNPRLLGRALSFLIQGAGGRHYIQAVVDAYKANVPDVDERLLAAAAVHDADEVGPVLGAAISREGDSKERALAALANSLDIKVQALGDHIVRSYLKEARGVVDFNVSRYVEDRLSHSHVISNDLNEVIRRVIAAPAGSGRHILAYPLTSPDGISDSAQRTALLREFIIATTDDESAVLTAQLLIREVVSEYSTSDAFELLQQVLTHLKGNADSLLFRAAYEDRKTFAGILAHWLSTQKLSPPGNYTQLLKTRVESGESPESAVKQIMLDAIKG